MLVRGQHTLFSPLHALYRRHIIASLILFYVFMSDPPYKYKADNYFDSDVEKGIKNRHSYQKGETSFAVLPLSFIYGSHRISQPHLSMRISITGEPVSG